MNCDDDDSNTDGTAGTHSDDGPVPSKDMTAGTLPAHSSLSSGSFVWRPPLRHAGSDKQACPVCFQNFSCGAGVRPDCVDRARKYVIMSHSEAKPDPRHQALALSIRLADPTSITSGSVASQGQRVGPSTPTSNGVAISVSILTSRRSPSGISKRHLPGTPTSPASSVGSIDSWSTKPSTLTTLMEPSGSTISTMDSGITPPPKLKKEYVGLGPPFD